MTLTDIANIALEDIGQKVIGNIDGDDFNSRRLKNRIFKTIETVQKRRNWVHLRKELKLALSAEKAANGFYKFILPKNLLNVISSSSPYKREHDFLISGFPDLRIYCTIASFNPDEWGINLTNAVIAQIKKDIVYPMSGDLQLANQVYLLAEKDIRSAILDDAYDEKNKVITQTGSWFNGW